MNTAALKSFASAVRRQSLEAVTRKRHFALTIRASDPLSNFPLQEGCRGLIASYLTDC
jgi:hypothetical protein